MLDAALGDASSDEMVGDIMVRAVVAHPDETLHAVANRMADLHVSRLPVVDRDDPTRVIGIVSLTQLLAARQRDQQEAREREQVLRVRLVSPNLWTRR